MNINSQSIKRSIFKLYQCGRGSNLFKHLYELERIQWLPTKEIKQIQWAKLKELLDYVYHNVPYYKKIFYNLKLPPEGINTPEDFRRLPLLTKDDIEKNISKIISSNYRDADLIENSTGGSTGRNLRFFIDRKRNARRESVSLRCDRWAGLDIGVKHAYLWGSSFDISLQDTLKNTIYNKMVGCGLFLSSYGLFKENMFLYAKQLQQYKPNVIIGYPSPLYLFAMFLEENNIEGITPNSIISSAETLYDFQRELIESVFGCKVFNRYASREFGAIALECSEHSGMHVNAEHVYVECLKEDGEPAAPEESGELIITDLDNYGMPFIRYKIGDVGTLSDRKCNCGRGLPIIETIEGRTFDIIVCQKGMHLGGTFWTLLLRTDVKGIKQFQVVQESKTELNINMVVDELFKPEYVGRLTNKIHKYCGENMKVNFEIVDVIPTLESGKFRFVISKVPPI